MIGLSQVQVRGHMAALASNTAFLSRAYVERGDCARDRGNGLMTLAMHGTAALCLGPRL